MLDSLTALARDASAMMLSAMAPAVHDKEGHFNFTTDTDLEIQEYLREKLKALKPEAQFFAEEQVNASLTDGPAFVVDPIDGTVNFSRKRNASAVSIAFLENRLPLMGVVMDPFRNELFTAVRGKGACLNGVPVHVSPTPLSRALVNFGSSPYDDDLRTLSLRALGAFLESAGDVRRSGSAALDLCDVACGRSDVFFELRLRPWDVAAGSLIVMEAGGIYRSLDHDSPCYDAPCGVFACSPACEEAWDILQRALRP